MSKACDRYSIISKLKKSGRMKFPDSWNAREKLAAVLIDQDENDRGGLEEVMRATGVTYKQLEDWTKQAEEGLESARRKKSPHLPKNRGMEDYGNPEVLTGSDRLSFILWREKMSRKEWRDATKDTAVTDDHITDWRKDAEAGIEAAESLRSQKEASNSKPLRDFDIVAHVVPVRSEKKFNHGGCAYVFQAFYLNKYGIEIGALVKDAKTSTTYSWDPGIWQEYLAMRCCDARAEGSKGEDK